MDIGGDLRPNRLMSTRPLRHLAQQRGHLRDEALTVRLRSFRSTDATTTALRDGVVPVTIGWRLEVSDEPTNPARPKE